MCAPHHKPCAISTGELGDDIPESCIFGSVATIQPLEANPVMDGAIIRRFSVATFIAQSYYSGPSFHAKSII